MPSGVCSAVEYLPVQATCDLIIATASASVSVAAAGAFRVGSTNNNQNQVVVHNNVPHTTPQKGIFFFAAVCCLGADPPPPPDKLVLPPRLGRTHRPRCSTRRYGNQCKGGYGEQYLVHGNLRGLRRS